MPDTTLYYLLIMVGSLFFPLALSFDKKVNFIQYFIPFIKSACLVATLFILGDIVYTKWGVWGFNEHYHLPFNIGGLPLEEILFFFVVPYACVFIYEVLLAYFKIKQPKVTKQLLLFLAILLLTLSAIFYNLLYTSISFLFSAIILFYLSRKLTDKTIYLLLAFLISFVPFFLVNGFLTGMFTPSPIVWYNDAENLGIRLISIPIEDLSYSFNLIAMNIIGYEFFKKVRAKKVLTS